MISNDSPIDRLLPEGVRDLLFADAASWREMEAALRETWRAWGYREIILPTFEYAETLATDVGAAIDREMYRFFDRRGRTLALRPELTIPTARVAGTRLFDQPMPLRIAYAGSAFRYEPPRAGRQHEFTQAGVELIGAPGSAADAEAVALAVASLRAAGLPEFRITLGHVGFFRGLLAGLGLPAPAASRLQGAVDRKAEAALWLTDEIERSSPRAREAALGLLRLTGDAGVLAEAETLCLNPTMLAAVSDLRSVARILDGYGVAEAVSYDLAEVRDLDYYTGVTFEGFAPGLGFAIVSGGRYDDLIGHFGPAQPAVGWALTLDSVLLARELQGVRKGQPASDLLLSVGDDLSCLAWANEARARGLRVEIDLAGLDGDALWQHAQERRIPRTAVRAEAGRLLVRDASGLRAVADDDWEEVARWRSR